MSLVFYLRDERETARLGRALARSFNLLPVIYLQGDLGTGKTCLVRHALRSLGYMEAVKSPTYTFLETHNLPEALIHHWDLYRIADVDELYYLGVRDLLASPAVWFIEWPELGGDRLPAPDLLISLRCVGEGREVTLAEKSSLGRELVDSLEFD